MNDVRSARDLLTPERLLDALRLVRDGVVHDLSVTLDADLLPPVDETLPIRPIERVDLMTPSQWQEAFDSGESGFNLDAISGSVHYGTHVDGLAHIVNAGRVFGDVTEADARDSRGWSAHGAETIPPIVGRGVLIDLVSLTGEPLADSHAITTEELEAGLSAANVELTAGDIVLVRTGKIAELRTNRERFLERQPGISVDAAVWLAGQGMAAFGSDTGGTEPQPVTDWTRTVHVELLTRRGIHLFEWLDLEQLSAYGRADFLFVAASIKVRGATGGWVRPLAIT